VIGALPVGTASFIGIVLIPRFPGPLVPPQGSLARAALPYGLQRRWGWQRTERALERGAVARAALCARAFPWGLEGLPGEPVRGGRGRRAGPALDSSPVVRLRAQKQRGARRGKGSCPRAPRAGPANLVAALTTGVLIGGIRGGVGRRPRFGAPGPEAGAPVFAARPARAEQRLFSGEAGRATIEQFPAATARAARAGRGRTTVPLRRAPPPSAQAGRGAPPGLGRGCLPGRSAPRDARLKTRRPASRSARSEGAAGGPRTAGSPPDPAGWGAGRGPGLQAAGAEGHDRPGVDGR
jgi:hypothetical protein